MTEILTTGLLGLYNRTNLFANVIEKDVIDVTMFINKTLPGSTLAANRVMMTSRAESMINTGRDLSADGFTKVLCQDMGRKVEKKEYDKMREYYQPEFNTVTNKIGEGYRKIGNTVMLTARADFHTKKGHDFMLYEYFIMLSANGSIKEDL